MGLYSLSDLEYMFWAAIRNGSVGTIGAKGDPGGFTTPTVIGAGVSLDTITTPGLYLNPNANATAGPANANQAVGGHLEVIASANWIIQRYTEINDPRVMYLRHRNSSSTWFPWYAFNTTRVDQTAGRAMYTWDDVNNREQLVYGDTGLRDISASLANGYTGSLYIRRYGSKVTLVGTLLRPPGTSLNGTFLAAIPSGFDPISTAWIFFPVRANYTSAWATLYRQGSVLLFEGFSGDTDASQVRFEISWETSITWPTALPGTASGTIPNL